MRKSGFTITGKKGFHIVFDNSWGISVQFGPGNYCIHYDRDIGREEEQCGKEGSPNAEIAILHPINGLYEYPEFEGDTVAGWKEPDYILKVMNWVASQPKVSPQTVDNRVKERAMEPYLVIIAAEIIGLIALAWYMSGENV